MSGRSAAIARRASCKGFLRDKMSVFFAIVFPLMFLVLFGGDLRRTRASRKIDLVRSATSRSSTSCRRARRQAFDETFEVTQHRRPGRRASHEVRKGDADVAVEMRGDTLVAHYTRPTRCKAAITQGTLNAFVDGANQAAVRQAADATRCDASGSRTSR